MADRKRRESAALPACGKDIRWEGKCLRGRPCMTGRRLTLDTNILFYALDRDAGDRHKLAIEIVDRASVFDSVLILQALCEFYAAVTGKNKIPSQEAEAQIIDWMELFPVVSPTSKSLTKALKAVNEHTLSFWDAMLWAVAREAGVTILLTEDFQHDRILAGVRFCNPFKLDNPIDDIFSDAL
jgi:predicted nucleic acid-binding protein